jgi:hypothetical protein
MERTDYNITDNFMHVIWAQGQDAGNYVHRPQTGVDVVSTASDPNFYKPDELKYHGHNDHRGVRTMNFFDGKFKFLYVFLYCIKWPVAFGLCTLLFVVC